MAVNGSEKGGSYGGKGRKLRRSETFKQALKDINWTQKMRLRLLDKAFAAG